MQYIKLFESDVIRLQLNVRLCYKTVSPPHSDHWVKDLAMPD